MKNVRQPSVKNKDVLDDDIKIEPNNIFIGTNKKQKFN